MNSPLPPDQPHPADIPSPLLPKTTLSLRHSPSLEIVSKSIAAPLSPKILRPTPSWSRSASHRNFPRSKTGPKTLFHLPNPVLCFVHCFGVQTLNDLRWKMCSLLHEKTPCGTYMRGVYKKAEIIEPFLVRSSSVQGRKEKES